MNPPAVSSSSRYLPPLRRFKGRGNNILVETAVKEKVGELEEEAREEFTRRPRKELTGVAEGVIFKKSCLVRFQYEFKK